VFLPNLHEFYFCDVAQNGALRALTDGDSLHEKGFRCTNIISFVFSSGNDLCLYEVQSHAKK
jgi:hypothetical protein